VYGTSVDAETGLSLLNGENGAFGYNGRDAHISMHGGNDDSIIILTMIVTDIYLDTDQISLIVAVDKERNVGPTTNTLREQETYVISYGKETRQTAVGGLDMDGNVCTADNLGAGDTDNDNLTFVWDYSYADAGTGGSALENFNVNGADNSFYGHVQNGGPALNDNGWQDIAYDLAEGDHTFKITATDPYDELASSSTTPAAGASCSLRTLMVVDEEANSS
jgi:hypothetical protein